MQTWTGQEKELNILGTGKLSRCTQYQAEAAKAYQFVGFIIFASLLIRCNMEYSFGLNVKMR